MTDDMIDDIIFPPIPPHRGVFRLIREIQASENLTRKEATRLVADICDQILEAFLAEGL